MNTRSVGRSRGAQPSFAPLSGDITVLPVLHELIAVTGFVLLLLFAFNQ